MNKLGARSIEIIQSEEQKEKKKRFKKNEQCLKTCGATSGEGNKLCI